MPMGWASVAIPPIPGFDGRLRVFDVTRFGDGRGLCGGWTDDPWDPGASCVFGLRQVENSKA